MLSMMVLIVHIWCQWWYRWWYRWRISGIGDTAVLVSFIELLHPFRKTAIRWLTNLRLHRLLVWPHNGHKLYGTQTHHELYFVQIHNWCSELMPLVPTWFDGFRWSKYPPPLYVSFDMRCWGENRLDLVCCYCCLLNRFIYSNHFLSHDLCSMPHQHEQAWIILHRERSPQHLVHRWWITWWNIPYDWPCCSPDVTSFTLYNVFFV